MYRIQYMYVTGSQASKKFGYNARTISRWALDGKIKYITSPGGHKRFLVSDLENISQGINTREIILYARVSTSTQKDDLETQRNYLSKHYPQAKVITDLGSGLNFKRKNFLYLMDQVGAGQIKKIVVGHKDRLCRFGFDFIEWYCNQNKCQIEVLDNSKLSPHQELMKDFMDIMHCFSSKLYFLRRYVKEIKNNNLDNIDNSV